MEQGVTKMAFTGDLEHLPIVDVIQLMNSTRKTGVLSVRGRKGESQLVFKDGYIVSASHLNNSVRIGQVLIEKGIITPQQLDQGLQRQQLDGADRKPLAITLIEMGLLAEQDAYKGLQHLIEMTVVEILTWKSGKFTLDHLSDVVHSEFKYYPEKMNHEVNVNTQSILMDALRIFDEKMRDGLIEAEPDEPAVAAATPDEIISADDLGLSELDLIETNVPPAFAAVAPFDPVHFQREQLQSLVPELSETVREKIATFLAKHTLAPDAEQKTDPAGRQLILAASDRLLIHALGTVARSGGISLTAVSSGAEAESAADSFMQQGKRTGIIFDAPAHAATEEHARIMTARNSLCSRYPGFACIQLVAADAVFLALDAYRSGVRAVVPRPTLEACIDSFAEELIALVEFLPAYLL